MSEDQTIRLASGGIQDTMRGTEYQLKIMQLFSLKGFNKNLTFKCWTEDARADKFDDVIFTQVTNGITKHTFLQAKQKANPKSIEFATFFHDKNYFLSKYFESFVKIEQSFEINYERNDIADVSICTNNNFPSPINGLVKLEDPDLELSLKFEKLEFTDAFDNYGMKFRFARDFENENFDFLKNHFLAIDLTKLLFENNSKTSLLQHSKEFLLSYVFSIKNKSIKFRPEFLEPGHLVTENFRKLFQFTVNCGIVAIPADKKKYMTENFWLSFEKLKFKGNLGAQIESFTNDQNYVDSTVRNFIKKFVIVTSLNELDIDKGINAEISPRFSDPNECNHANLEIHDKIKEWMTSNGEGLPITESKIDMIFKKLQVQNFISYFKKLNEKTFTTSNLIFSVEKPELVEFMESDEKVLIYEVPKNETSFGCIRLYQMENSIIHVKTQHNQMDFEKTLTILKHSTDKVCIVFECTGKFKKFLEIFDSLLSELKNRELAKIVIVCESESSQNFSELPKFVDTKTLCGELDNDSLNKCLEEEVNFQGPYKFPVKNLINPDDVNSTSLQDLKRLTDLGTTLESAEIYLPRTLLCNIHLKKTILDDFNAKKFEDFICFSEKDYESTLQNSQNLPVHWINQTDKLQWKRSNCSIQNLRSYVDEIDPFNIKDSDFLKHAQQMNLLSGIAGMGKSLFLLYIANEFKKKYPNYWVQKLDLQLFFDDLKLFKQQEFGEEDYEKIHEFFYDHFMKFENQLELQIFKRFLQEGRVVLLFDGFDEVNETYENTVIQLVYALMKVTKGNKFFISSRTEWTESLENTFSQFSFAFQPFSKRDQQDYLLHLWNKDENWQPVSEMVLSTLHSSITEREKTFTGIPLITRLVAEYFIGKLDDICLKNPLEFQKKLEDLNFTLFDLLNDFIDKKFEIYCSEKLRIDRNNPHKKRILKFLKIDHQKLSFKILFPTNVEEIFPFLEDLDEDTIRDFVACGLVQYVNGRLKFHHQTFAEFLVAIYIKDNFNRIHVLEFVFKVVLIKIQYKLVRSFINSFMKENVISDENKGKVKDLLADAMKVSAKERNTETFEILFNMFLENASTMEISDEDSLMMTDSDGFNMFVYYLSNCEVSMESLDKFEIKFGLKFIKNLLQSNNKDEIMAGMIQHGKNCFFLMKWILQHYSDDFKFISDIINTKDSERNTILHGLTKKLDMKLYLPVLEDLVIFEKSSKKYLTSDLILTKNSTGQTFIYSLIDRLSNDNSETDEEDEENSNEDILIDVMNWVATTHQGILEKILTIVDENKRSLTHYVAFKFSKGLAKFIKFVNTSLNSTNFLKKLEKDGNSFLNLIAFDHSGDNVTAVLIEILQWLKETDEELLEEVVYARNKTIQTFLHFFFEHAPKKILPSLLKESIDWMTSNLPHFNLQKFLTVKTKSGDSFFNLLVLNDNENLASSALIEILDFLKSVDEKLTNQIVFWENGEKENFIHYFCRYARKIDLPELLKQSIDWMTSNLHDFNVNNFLTSKTKAGSSILNHAIMNENYQENEVAQATENILNWIKETSKDLLIQLLHSKNNKDQNLFFEICQNTECENQLKSLLEWIRENLPGFNLKEVLLQKDKDDHIFLHQLADKEKHATRQIMTMLKDLDNGILEDLLKEDSQLDHLFGDMDPNIIDSNSDCDSDDYNYEDSYDEDDDNDNI